jgi:hypothetical protein
MLLLQEAQGPMESKLQATDLIREKLYRKNWRNSGCLVVGYGSTTRLIELHHITVKKRSRSR